MYSTWADVRRGVHQGSVLGPILFNIFINYLLYFATDTEICNFADDNTIYPCDDSLSKVIIKLENDLGGILQWFELNSMIANPTKFQFMIMGRNVKKLVLHNGDKNVVSSDTIKLLGITIDKCLKFNQHIDELCKKAKARLAILYICRCICFLYIIV